MMTAFPGRLLGCGKKGAQPDNDLFWYDNLSEGFKSIDSTKDQQQISNIAQVVLMNRMIKIIPNKFPAKK